MSESEEWSDDNLWEEEEDYLDLRRTISYELLQENDILKRQAQAIDKLSDELGFSYIQSAVLLIQNQWNPQKVLEKIMNNSIDIPFLKRQCSSTLNDDLIVLCLLCYTDKKGSRMRALDCNHAFCDSCYREYLKESVLSGTESIFTKCPMSNCEVLVPQELFKELLIPKLYERYKRFILRSYVDNRSDVKWCPAPNCTCAVSYPKKNTREILCKCGFSWCFSCGKESHKPLTCELFTKWNQRLVSDDSEQWLLANTKECPKCHNAIQKNLGCMHMTCKCSYQFCWLCLGD